MQAKARMGVIISSSNRMVEPQLRHFAPPALGLHVTRMRMASKWGKLPSDLLGEILAAAALLADAKVDVIVFQATGVAMKMGEAIEARFMNTITEETGVAALSATQAMVEALGALALRKLVIVSPFDSATNDFERAYLEGRGFTVVHDIGLDLHSGDGPANLAPESWVEAVVANARPDADGYFLSGSNTTLMEAVGAIETATGKAAVNSTQATLWAAMARLRPKLGAATIDPALGRLFSRAMALWALMLTMMADAVRTNGGETMDWIVFHE